MASRCLTVLALVGLVLFPFPDAHPAPDFLIVNRASGDIVHHSDLSDTCRYPIDLPRFGTPGSAAKIFTVNGEDLRRTHILYSGIDAGSPQGIVFMERLPEGGYAEGRLVDGNEILAAVSVPQADHWITLVKTGGKAFMELRGARFFVADLDLGDLGDLAVDPKGSVFVLVSLRSRTRLLYREYFNVFDEFFREETIDGQLLTARFARLNRDSEPDVTIMDEKGITVRLRTINGELDAPRHTADPLPATWVHATPLLVGDFDGDRNTDLLLRGQTILLGDGSGSFPRSRPSGLMSEPRYWIGDAADLNLDGYTDVVSSFGNSPPQVFAGRPGGELKSLADIEGAPVNPSQILLTDVDGDGRVDALFAQGSIWILPGIGDGSFGPSRTIKVGGFPVDAAEADLDEDGKPEVIVLMEWPDRIKILRWREDGFDSPSFLDLPRTFKSLYVRDVGGDRHLDIVVNDVAGRLLVFPGDGKGSFAPPQEIAGMNTVLLLEDLSDDRIPDAVSATGPVGPIEVHAGTGGAFIREVLLPTGREPVHAAAHDADGDGRRDLFVANRLDSTVSYFRSRGDLSFDDPVVLPSGGGPSRLALLDLLGDRNFDLVSLNVWTDDISVFEGLPLGRFRPERRILGQSGLRDLAYQLDGRPFVAALGESPYYAVDIYGRDYLPFPTGGSDCQGFTNPGKDPVRLLIVDFAPVLFIRGDVNADGTLDISDSIGILGWLFFGDRTRCLDALDVDDSGAVDLTDAVGLLSHLFQGTSAPPPPRRSPGKDPQPDLLVPCGREA